MGNRSTLNKIFIETGYAASMIKEAIEMGNTPKLDKILIETGLAAMWEARGRAEGEQHKAFGIAQNLVKLGLPIETVISATQLDPEKVKTLYSNNR
jgi:predicted transposase YdaD